MSENPKAQALGFFILLGPVNRQNMNPSCLRAFVDVAPLSWRCILKHLLSGMTQEHYRQHPSALPYAESENGRVNMQAVITTILT